MADEILPKLKDLLLGQILVDTAGIDKMRINLCYVITWNIAVLSVLLPLDGNH